ncbi:MAG TPA: hypothetical protein ENH74_02495 [Methylophaga sp.]|nr:hypothetical protein [Methylophaga sp.]
MAQRVSGGGMGMRTRKKSFVAKTAAMLVMTIVPFSAVELGSGMNGGGLKVIWAGLTETDTADAWNGGIMFPEKSVQVEGTHGTTVIEGSNDETNYETLTDRQGGNVSFVADGIREIEENPRQIRPRVSAGTSVSVNVTIIVSRGKD